MLPNTLERYLHDHIPISKAMGVSIAAADEVEVILRAPLAANINHRDTVFGGSASAVATLAAWSLLHTRLQGDGFASRLVIQRNTMAYDLPIAGDFTARATYDPETDWARFTKILSRKGKARITVASVLEYQGRVAGRFSGEFVAFGSERLARAKRL